MLGTQCKHNRSDAERPAGSFLLVDTEKCSVPLSEFSDIMSRLGREHGLDIHVMHEDVFDSMYHV